MSGFYVMKDRLGGEECMFSNGFGWLGRGTEAQGCRT
jgi:hypothetical protein